MLMAALEVKKNKTVCLFYHLGNSQIKKVLYFQIICHYEKLNKSGAFSFKAKKHVS